jgi:hypothetical protein
LIKKRLFSDKEANSGKHYPKKAALLSKSITPFISEKNNFSESMHVNCKGGFA